jgi:hypothetical protein
MSHRKFANQKALIDYAELSPDQYQTADVRTLSRGVRRVMLLPKAILEG